MKNLVLRMPVVQNSIQNANNKNQLTLKTLSTNEDLPQQSSTFRAQRQRHQDKNVETSTLMGTDHILSPKLPYKKKKMLLNSGIKEIRDRQDDMQHSRILSPFRDRKQSKL